jgi:hypothetical protein
MVRRKVTRVLCNDVDGVGFVDLVLYEGGATPI